MQLWNWISEQLLPLFGDLPDVALDLGHLGTLTIENMLQIMFWICVGYVVVNVLVLWPYHAIRKLLRIRKEK